MTAIIETNQLSCALSGRLAVESLTCTVEAGTIFGLIGPNGAGKTTTIRLLLGLLEPTSGSARVLGFDTQTDGDAIRAQTGALLEHTGLYERLSAEDNLEFYARVSRLPRQTLRARVREVLESLNLYDRRKDSVSTWSRGMKQRLAVARALIHRPRVLFLDEPTNGLDPVAAAALRADLRQLVEREGVTLFLTTHNLAEAETLCRTVAIMQRGRLLTVGTPEQLRSAHHAATLEHALLEIVERAS
jgi:ABC-2 type transport system ATP-binding protein